MTLLLVIFLLLGFMCGIFCTTLGIEKHHPTAWRILVLEIEANKRKRADAARDKEA